MRKMKRFFAVLLSAALLCPMTAYADNSEDAKALYHQVSETQKSITDMNAFADFKISIGGSILEDTGVDAMNLRMEMNMKMNHMTEPQQMRYMMYSRTTMDGMEEPMIISAYYQDGCYYQDSMGQKVKMPMDIGTMMEQSMASAMAFEDEFENYLSNFRLWDEGENKVIGFVAEADQMNEYFRMEMNMKMNHMTEPQQMRYMMYSRTTMDGMEEPMIISAYYQDGCYYQDSMGQKVKMPMDIGTMMEQSMASAMAFEDEFENYLSNFRLWDEGENKVIGFVAEADQMNEYFQMVMSSTGMSGLLDTAGITMGDVIYEYVIDPAGNCIKMRMKMDMAMEADGESITMKLDGDIGIADPGQPVEVPTVPDPEAYQDFETLIAEAVQAEQQ